MTHLCRNPGTEPLAVSSAAGASRSHRWGAIVVGVSTAFAWWLVGCAATPTAPSPVLLRATGDPGVTVRVRATLAGVPEQVVAVPAELTFHGENFELRCVHGPQPGRLSLIATHGGLSISTGDTTQPGQVTQIIIRPTSLAIGVPEVQKTK